MLEYKSGTFSHIWLTSGTEPDQNQMNIAIENIQKGELLIHDLGYFSQDAIKEIKAKEAFFLSRYYPKTALYYQTNNGDWQRLYLPDALRNSKNLEEFAVRYGAKAKVSCRLIAKRVCDEVAQRRKRKKRQAAKKKGRTISPLSLALCHWDLYVTNIPSSFVPAEYISNLYRIR